MIPARLLRPPRVRTQLFRTGFTLCGLALLLLAPFRLSPDAAGRISLFGLLALSLVILLFVAGGWRRIRRLIPDSAALFISPVDGMEILVGLIRRTGLAPLGLVFLVFWMLVYMGAWALQPESCSADLSAPCAGALAGSNPVMPLGDFMFLSINLAVANPPADLFPVSSLAHALASLQLLSGLALITFAASAFFGVRSSGETSAD